MTERCRAAAAVARAASMLLRRMPVGLGWKATAANAEPAGRPPPAAAAAAAGSCNVKLLTAAGPSACCCCCCCCCCWREWSSDVARRTDTSALLLSPAELAAEGSECSTPAADIVEASAAGAESCLPADAMRARWKTDKPPAACLLAPPPSRRQAQRRLAAFASSRWAKRRVVLAGTVNGTAGSPAAEKLDCGPVLKRSGD